MSIPERLWYSRDHEWIDILRAGDDLIARIGITHYAQDALGDIVYVQLPAVGITVSANSSFSEVESTKSVSDVFAPVSGEVVNVNEELRGSPEKLNTDPYGDGWICTILMSDIGERESLMNAAEYGKLIGQ